MYKGDGTTQILTTSDARYRLLSLIRNISKDHQKYLLVHRGTPKAVIMEASEYESLIETLGLLEDPGMLPGLKEADEDIKKGRTYSVKEVFDKKLKKSV